MKSKLIMRISSILIAMATIYMIIVWEPDSVNTENANEEVASVVGNETIDNVEGKSEESVSDTVGGLGESDNIQIEENDSQAVIANVFINVESFESIIASLTVEEKIKYNNIFNKLSVVDHSRVNNMLHQDDKNRGVIEVISLFKKRLNDKDYNELEEIMKQYLDFNAINNNV